MEKLPTVELQAEDARVALEICDMMQAPMDPGGVAKVIRMASYLQPILEDAFEQSGMDPSEVEMPSIPLIRPGDLHQPG
jgi:hypothetical protein